MFGCVWCIFSYSAANYGYCYCNRNSRFNLPTSKNHRYIIFNEILFEHDENVGKYFHRSRFPLLFFHASNNGKSIQLQCPHFNVVIHYRIAVPTKKSMTCPRVYVLKSHEPYTTFSCFKDAKKQKYAFLFSSKKRIEYDESSFPYLHE